MEEDQKFLQMAVDMAGENVRKHQCGPFGAVIVRDGEIIGRGVNRVLRDNDPTAHAEVTAIRDACKNTGHFRLDGAVIYTSCEPCPMCLSAIYWARIDRIVFASSHLDASEAGFDDSYIYEQIPLPFDMRSIPASKIYLPDHKQPFIAWTELENKTLY